jgi:hypothetical protein
MAKKRVTGRDQAMTQRTDARAVEAHRKTVSSEISEIVAYLQETLGSNLVAFVADVSDVKAVWRWAKAENKPRPEAEKRLRATYQVLQLLLSADSAYVARAWLVGTNPQLDDEAPIEAIRDGRFRDALIAARAYIAGG